MLYVCVKVIRCPLVPLLPRINEDLDVAPLVPDHLAWSVVWSFAFSFAMLVALGCASTVHGGASADPRLGHGFLMPGFYATQIVFNRCFHANNDAFMVDVSDELPTKVHKPIT